MWQTFPTCHFPVQNVWSNKVDCAGGDSKMACINFMGYYSLPLTSIYIWKCWYLNICGHSWKGICQQHEITDGLTKSCSYNNPFWCHVHDIFINLSNLKHDFNVSIIMSNYERKEPVHRLCSKRTVWLDSVLINDHFRDQGKTGRFISYSSYKN